MMIAAAGWSIIPTALMIYPCAPIRAFGLSYDFWKLDELVPIATIQSDGSVSRLGLARIVSAGLVQTNGTGSALWRLM